MSTASLNPLPKLQYPAIEPYDTGRLKVSDIHTLYYEQVGNPNGKPVVFLHGGPGGGCGPDDRRFFDPAVYRVVLFDQRGAGRSEPHACLEENTTPHLVADIERIREHLKIDKWIVFGGSWGSTLSLAYSQAHPDRVKALVLRGIFLLRRKELEFFYQSGASYIFPEQWDEYLAAIPKEEHGDLITAYHKRLSGTNEEEQRRCAAAWSKWECATSRLFVDPEYVAKAADGHWALAFARIESHYFFNGGFFRQDDQLLADAHKIKDIPTFIVQGRYDVVCPAMSAWDLHKALPDSKLFVIPDAGHSAREAGICDKLISIMNDLRSKD